MRVLFSIGPSWDGEEDAADPKGSFCFIASHGLCMRSGVAEAVVLTLPVCKIPSDNAEPVESGHHFWSEAPKMGF
jgi:hypothetical protein